ncbi:DUF1059 domain-containing protein [Rhodococcus fascians]|nr:DUF1059 domain-containing protein [Rhodococcus fascians]MBY4114613.1 DUF1059 domain-containing protein [Rhodococcus fascians]
MRYVQCPCGELLEGESDDRLVDEVQQHLRQEHPALEYHRDQILSLAY